MSPENAQVLTNAVGSAVAAALLYIGRQFVKNRRQGRERDKLVQKMVARSEARILSTVERSSHNVNARLDKVDSRLDKIESQIKTDVPYGGERE